MDATGPIFVVLAVACLFYFIPRRLSWRIPTQEEIQQQTPLHLSMKTIHSGVPVEPESRAGENASEVSTLLMRRAGRRNALRLARRAERRRIGVFVALLAICLVTIPFAALGWMIRWWVPLAGAGIVIAWSIFSHIEARRVQRQLDALVAETELGDDEKTMTVKISEEVTPSAESVVIGPNGDMQMSLWDPITIVPVTYISAPKAPRTVRTIDLNAPVMKFPVTDDRRESRRGDSRFMAF